MSLENEKLINLLDLIDKRATDIFNKIAKSGDVELTEMASELCDVITATSALYETGDIFEDIVATANDFDSSDDPRLQKAADLLDNILQLKTSIFRSASSEDEINKLRSEYSDKTREHNYGSIASEQYDKNNAAEQTAKAFKDQVKQYRVLEAPLSTRYDPDHPGVGLIRISDNVYQSSLTGKVYDYYSGYTTNKGNKIPGSSVDRQIPDWSNDTPSGFMFDTREGRLSRFASLDDKKKV
jgi:cell fate (sporulation/competence/biofilm development) regulator YmcA (YheA/YmcA/DUF963 family)